MRNHGVPGACGHQFDRHRRVGLVRRERLAVEIGEGERLGLGERMLLREHRDRELLPELHQVQTLGVDGQAHEREVGVARDEVGELLGLVDADRLDGEVGPELLPDAQPLRGAHPGDVAKPQRHPRPQSSWPPKAALFRVSATV